MSVQLLSSCFTSVRILKEQLLGSGTYGTVYKAKCDDLLCAAKVFQAPNTEVATATGQLGEQLEVLSSLRHPNIVLSLGVSQDLDTGAPILLMELLDNNLTHFLENTQVPLPFHTEANICHDVAMALSFLHSNGIIHGCLSSNNVLMVGSSRAKVVDFGIAHASMPKAAERNIYMPLDADSTMSQKLDCFSFGILSIQIVTNVFPMQPSNMLPAGNEEVDRRKMQLDLVAPDHLLLPLIIDCIKDNEASRPSASDICKRLLDKKTSPQYAASFNPASADIVLDDIDKLVKEMQYFPMSSEGGGSISRPSTRGNSLEPTDQQSMEMQLSVTTEQTAAAEEIKRLKDELERLQKENEQLLSKEKSEETSVEAAKVTETANEDTSYESPASVAKAEEEVASQQERDAKMLEKQREEIHGLNENLERALTLIDEQEQLLQSSDTRFQALEEEKKRLEGRLRAESMRSLGERQRTLTVGPLRNVTLKWIEEVKAPQALYRATEALVTTGNVIFVRPGGTKELQAFNIETHRWSRFPDTPVTDCSLTLIRRNLTIIGGKTSSKQFTNKAISLINSGGERKWIEVYPRMAVKRSNLVTVQCQTTIIAVGGEDESGYLQVVEVLDSSAMENMSWYRVADTPEPIAMASATLCAGRLYLMGGWVESMTPTQTVFSAPMESLLRSKSADDVWEVMASIPTKGSTCVSVKERLLAVGGRDAHEPTTAIHMYNPVKDSWEVLAHMANPRHQCFAAVVEGGKLVVMGGWILTTKQLLSETRNIEVASIL